jgi:hypothetical protein
MVEGLKPRGLMGLNTLPGLFIELRLGIKLKKMYPSGAIT